MTDREFFIYTITDELPRFERLFKAVPSEHADYKPDPKSKTAVELMDYTATEGSTFRVFLETGKVNMAEYMGGSGHAASESVTVLLRGLEEAKDTAANMTEEQWDSPAAMLMGEKVEWETTRGKMAWSLLLDAIHHRGQLATYIRPMGGKVPSIYGPSADTQS